MVYKGTIPPKPPHLLLVHLLEINLSEVEKYFTFTVVGSHHQHQPPNSANFSQITSTLHYTLSLCLLLILLRTRHTFQTNYNLSDNY